MNEFGKTQNSKLLNSNSLPVTQNSKLLPAHIYFYRYDTNEQTLCALETRCLFKAEIKDKLLLSDIEISPAQSPFIKKRLDILAFSKDYKKLLHQIQSFEIKREDFKVEYIVLEGDASTYAERLAKLKDIGYSIEGIPDYHNPKYTFAICLHEGTWCFGELIKNGYDWHKHRKKPRSYSNSININIAKALVNIAAQGDKSKHLLDGCCGAGTVLLEACFAGYSIAGCDINWKLCHDARANLAHFGYTAPVYRSDIKDIGENYDAVILDLPYNLLSDVSEQDIVHIIQSAAQLAHRLVVVSIADIGNFLSQSGFRIETTFTVPKKGKRSFARRIWLAAKE